MNARVMAEGFQRGNFLGNEAERRLHVAAGDVDISPEAADAFDLQRVVELPFLLEGGALRFGESVEDEIPDGVRV